MREDASGGPRAVKQALFSAAQRGRSWIVGQSPVDRGILKNAWRALRMSDGAELVNDQPYAGVVERGARPFKMNTAGMDALTGWVRRKILSGGFGSLTTGKGRKNSKPAQIDQIEKEARKIAFAIAKKFERVGIRGKRFVWRNLPILANLMEKEIQRSLAAFFNRSVGSGGGI